MLKNWYVGVVVAVIFLAAILRLYRLGDVPHGMTWDEAAIGYNGHAILVARRDEWLNRLPVSFRSFGDYKSPLAIYLNGAFTGLLGMQLWVVRLPFALSGIAGVVGMMLLTRRLLTVSIPMNFKLLYTLGIPWLVVAAGLMTATSPWHLHFSRVGFESGMALTFLIIGIWLLLETLNYVATRWVGRFPGWGFQVLLALGAAIFLVASMYTYHSAKIVAPALAVMVLGLWLDKVREKWAVLLGFVAMSGVLVWPLLSDTLWGLGGERFHQATLFNKGLTSAELIRTLTTHFFDHLGPQFLIFGTTPTLRHGDGSWGVLFLTTLVLILVGFAAGGHQLLMVMTRQSRLAEVRFPLLAISWLLIGMAPAAVGIDVPHSNRALLALPGFILLAIWGMSWLVEAIRVSRFNLQALGTHGEKQTLLKIVVGLWLLIHSLLFISYQRHYYTTFAADSAEEFKDGYLEAFAYVIPYEKGIHGVKEVDQIIFTSDYGQPYIYALFVRRTNPIYYQGGSLIKYLFLDTITTGDLDRKNTLIVASATDDIPIEKADHLIYGSDGQVRFKIYRTPE